MLSAESTVTTFSMPDTDRLTQWPVITTWLETPLTMTERSLQAMVRFSLIPETLTVPPGGAVDTVGASVGTALGVRVRVLAPLEVVGRPEMVAGPLPDIRYTATPPARTSAPTANTAMTIHNPRRRAGGCGGGGNGELYGHCWVGGGGLR